MRSFFRGSWFLFYCSDLVVVVVATVSCLFLITCCFVGKMRCGRNVCLCFGLVFAMQL